MVYNKCMLNPKVLKILLDNKELYRDEILKMFHDDIIQRYSFEKLNEKINKIEKFNNDLISILEQNHVSTTITHKCVYDILNNNDLCQILNIVTNSWKTRLGIDEIKISCVNKKISDLAGFNFIEKEKFENLFFESNLVISNHNNNISNFNNDIKSHINYDISFDEMLPKIMVSYGSKQDGFFDETYNIHNISFITNVLGIKIASCINQK